MDARFSEIQQHADKLQQAQLSWAEFTEQRVLDLMEQVAGLREEVSQLRASLQAQQEQLLAYQQLPKPVEEPLEEIAEEPEVAPLEEHSEETAEELAEEIIEDFLVEPLENEPQLEIQATLSSREREPELPFEREMVVDEEIFVELNPEAEPISEQEQQLSILEAAARKSQPAWLVDLAGPSVTDVRKALSLNDRIVLIRELFNGSGDLLAATLDAVNQASNLSEFVEKMRREHPQWDEQSPLVYRFYMIVRRKIRD
ncbi:MAG: hypothetical protein IKV28_06890 [Bacteroidales bacterium]|nr:hypothetical protein [Bacteroidales bacterium]